MAACKPLTPAGAPFASRQRAAGTPLALPATRCSERFATEVRCANRSFFFSRRDAGNALERIDASLSCAKFRDEAWLAANRPEWPPNLVENAQKYAAAVPQGPIVMPSKGSTVDRSQCSVLLSRPGIGDAVPCF